MQPLDDLYRSKSSIARKARTGGAPVLEASLRVAFRGALAMGLTAAVFRLSGTVV